MRLALFIFHTLIIKGEKEGNLVGGSTDHRGISQIFLQSG